MKSNIETKRMLEFLDARRKPLEEERDKLTKRIHEIDIAFLELNVARMQVEALADDSPKPIHDTCTNG